MAKYVYKDGVVTVNAVDLSDHVKSCTVKVDYDVHETQAMGSSAKERLLGVYDWSVEIEWFQDTAANEVDQTLWPLVGAAAFPITVKPASGAIAASNPEFQGNVVLPSYSPINGSHGSLAMATTTFLGSGALTRDVTP